MKLKRNEKMVHICDYNIQSDLIQTESLDSLVNSLQSEVVFEEFSKETNCAFD